MGLGSPGGAGPGGHGAGDSGSGGGGGGRGDGGYIGLDNPDIDPQAVQNDFTSINSEIEASLASGTGSDGSTTGNIVGTVVGILGFLATGSITAATALGMMTAKNINKAAATNAISNVQQGAKPNEAFNGIVSDMGGPEQFTQSVSQPSQASQEAYADPKSDDFWNQLVKEWRGLKDSLENQQKFRREELAPAFKNYKQRLSGLSNEPGFKPISVGMGNFSTSFLPKRAASNAQSMLNADLSQTDINDPERANLSYLDRLKEMGTFQKQIENKINIAGINNERPDDQGTWLDAIADVMKVGSAGADIYDKIWGD
jgi:hypothetical protein